MESSEFQDLGPAAGYGAPLLSQPWLLLTAVLLAALLLYLGYYFGARLAMSNEDRRRQKRIDSLWDDINKKAKTAAGAPRHLVIAEAQNLLTAIQLHLGPALALLPVLNFANDLHGALHPGSHGAGHHGGAHAAAQGAHASESPSDSHAGGEVTSSAAQSQSQAQTTASQINISIGTAPATGTAHPPGGGAGLDIQAIRDAVFNFRTQWDRPAMRVELRAAQRALG